MLNRTAVVQYYSVETECQILPQPPFVSTSCMSAPVPFALEIFMRNLRVGCLSLVLTCIRRYVKHFK